MGDETRRHYQQITQVLWIEMLANVLVAGAKLIYGVLAHSMSMTADGLHSLLDGLNNIVGLVSIHIASQPADKDHHYGHQRFETIAALGVSFFLFLACYELFKQALARLMSGEAPPYLGGRAGFVIMLLCMLTNVLVSRYERKKGEELSSPILLADAVHTEIDVGISLSVLVSLAALEYKVPWVDLIISIFIGIYLAKAAFGVLKENILILSDAAPIDCSAIEDIVLRVKQVRGCHKIRTRGSGKNIFVDLHLLVNPETPTLEAHEIAGQVSALIRNNLDGVEEVLVHIEPFTGA